MVSNYIEDEYGLKTISNDSSLYHYTSACGLKGLLDGEIWMTESHFLNDRSEFGVASEAMAELLRARMIDQSKCEAVISRFRKEADALTSFDTLQSGGSLSGFYVMSLCIEPDSSLLWSEFTEFEGYSLEVGLGDLVSGLPCNSFWHGAVVYDSSEHQTLIEHAIKHDLFAEDQFPEITGWESFDALTLNELIPAIQHLSMIALMFNMFFKNECFAGENEYRVVVSAIHEGGIVRPDELTPTDFRVRDGVLSPFIRVPFNAANAIKSITVGPLVNSEIAAQGLRYYLSSKHIDADIKRSSIPLRF